MERNFWKVANFGVFCLLFVSLGGATQHDAESTTTCPCLNGGIFTGDACVCPTGYAGLYCETETADPEPYVPCADSCNNGYCDYTSGCCVCHSFYTGDFCNITLIRPCGDYYCFNGATCESDAATGEEYCQCRDGYSGDYCHYVDDACFCRNGGTCVTSANSTTCNCPAGFTGDYCESEICIPECQGNAYCRNGTCQCYPGYTGVNCTDVDDCASGWEECGDYYCFNGGTCQNDTCVCPEGFGGDYCLYSSVEACGDYYCFNGGACENGNCVCAEGFGGEYCQYSTDCTGNSNSEDLESCGNYVCLYGGTCLNNTCQCPQYTYGVYCEYVQVPVNRPTLVVTGVASSATLHWSVPIGYESIAQSGGLTYTVAVENMATGRTDNVMISDTSTTQTLTQATEYCFSVRAEVSGGVGVYSDRKCYTTPGHGSCFCVNDGVYDTETAECQCQDSYRGDYCEVPITEIASCPAESKYNSELGHIFAWSKTTAGQSVRLPCPCNSTLDLTSEIYATRSCSVEGIWLSTDSSGCSATAVKDLCEIYSPSDLLNKLAAPRTEPLEAGDVAITLKAVEVLATDDTQSWPTQILLDSLDDTLSTPNDVLTMTQQNTNAATVLVRALDEIGKDALEGANPGSSWMQNRTNFAVSGMVADRENLPDEGFRISFGSGFNGSVKALLFKHVFNEMVCNSSTFVSSVISKIALFRAIVEGDVNQNSRIVSHIFTITIGNCTINGSVEAIEITFKVPQSAHYSTLDCYYWKPSASNGLGAWSRDGCTKKGQLQSGEVVCSCNLLASFAVLQTFPVGYIEVTVWYIVIIVVVILVCCLLTLVIAVVWCCCYCDCCCGWCGWCGWCRRRRRRCRRAKRCCATSGVDDIESLNFDDEHEWPSENGAMSKVNPLFLEAVPDTDKETNFYQVLPTKFGAEADDSTTALYNTMEMPGVVIDNPICAINYDDEDMED